MARSCYALYITTTNVAVEWNEKELKTIRNSKQNAAAGATTWSSTAVHSVCI